MATQTLSTGRTGRFGQLTMRLVAVGLLALLALGTAIDHVSAQGSPNSYQNGFTAACRNHGGQPKRVGSRIVKCTLGDGTVITCDFNTDPPTCSTKLVAGAYADDIAAVGSGLAFDVSEPAPSGPKSQVAIENASSSTSILTRSDDQP